MVIFEFTDKQQIHSTTSLGKVMLTLFWGSKWPILEHYMSKGTTIISSSYCDLSMNHQKQAIRSNCRGLLTTVILQLQDNIRSKSAHATVAKIQEPQI